MLNAKFMAAAACAAFLPVAASAVTTNVSQNLSEDWNIYQSIVTAGNSVAITYHTNGGIWIVDDLSLTANGLQANIARVSVTLGGVSYSQWVRGAGNTATMDIPGFTTSQDFTITYYYNSTNTKSVAVSVSFSAVDPPAVVPLPAAGLLLVSALAGAGGIASLRRRKSA